MNDAGHAMKWRVMGVRGEVAMDKGMCGREVEAVVE